MPKSRTVTDYLSEMPEDHLKRMREATRQELARAQSEVTRLSVEAQQIDEAIAKKQRGEVRTARLTAPEVLDAVARLGEVRVAEVVRHFADEGIATTPNAVRNHLDRLHKANQLIRVDDRYSVPQASTPAGDFPSSPTDDDIPF